MDETTRAPSSSAGEKRVRALLLNGQGDEGSRILGKRKGDIGVGEKGILLAELPARTLVHYITRQISLSSLIKRRRHSHISHEATSMGPWTVKEITY